MKRNSVEEMAAGPTVRFLGDGVGMRRERIAALTGLSVRDVDILLSGGTAALAEGPARAIRGLAAIQSLLLSGYTPSGAAAWLRHPCRSLSNRSPREMLSSDDPGAIAAVLRAVAARLGT